ncbi:MAG: hypothetical protein JW395_1806 [Nitrospira sp.]|nr:hypothetical protein [Nitrospira sp.]
MNWPLWCLIGLIISVLSYGIFQEVVTLRAIETIGQYEVAK